MKNTHILLAALIAIFTMPNASAAPVGVTSLASLDGELCRSNGATCRIVREPADLTIVNMNSAQQEVHFEFVPLTDDIQPPASTLGVSSFNSAFISTFERPAGFTRIRDFTLLNDTGFEPEFALDDAIATPLPAAAPLLLSGLAGIGLYLRRRRRA